METPNVKVIFVDDSEADLQILSLFAKKLKLDFETYTNPHDALKTCCSMKGPFLLISDISMPEMDGFRILKELKSRGPGHVIFISGNTEIDYPIKAMREGALDYLTKPLSFEAFEARVLKAIENVSTKQELKSLRQDVFSGHSFESFVGRSDAIQRIYAMIMKIAEFDSTVLITGESGVGKERVARALHERSARSGAEFVAVNCASLPENLIESELFGYVKGAFTGADRDTPGLFAAAHKGTIFLDEIGELPPHLQAKLLRVLQEKEIRPVGGKKSTKVDVRIICATHRNLEEQVREGKFREDLYFRLNVIPIHIPPLRERVEDLRILIPYFVQKLNDKWDLSKSLNEDAWSFLESYHYPGNVRELENMLERAYILSTGKIISKDDFTVTKPSKQNESIFNLNSHLPSLKEVELSYIREIMRRSQTKEQAAEVLGIGRKTLYRKEFEIDVFFKHADETLK